MEKDGNGHGCGYNLLGTGSLTAARTLRYYIEENNIEGTVCYYDCPEESGGVRRLMVRKESFDDVIVA